MARHGRQSRPGSVLLVVVMLSVESSHVCGTDAAKRVFLKVELDITAMLLDDTKDLLTISMDSKRGSSIKGIPSTPLL